MISNTLPLYDVDFEVPKEHQYSFQSIFSYLKKKMQIKNTRKSKIDSLLKKCKGKFFKAIHDAIKLCLNLLVKRIPQKFITNITIEFNQKNFEKKIIDIYHEFNLLPSIDEIIEKKLLRKGKEDLFKEIAACNYQELYEMYIKSERYKGDTEKIKKKEGQKLALLYNFVAKNFSVYYLYGKAHIQRDKDFVIDNGNMIIDNSKIKKKILFVVHKSGFNSIQSNLFD